MQAALAGFTLGLSLIIAIGAQNSFVLRQGLKHQHVFLVCAICAVSDALLISFGVSGFHLLLEQAPWLDSAARYGGAAFLSLYGLQSLYAAWRKQHSLEAGDDQSQPVLVIALTCLAFTWLNPHVYLDTVMLVGSISTQYPGEKFNFGAGAVLSSFVFFFALGYGAKRLRPLFAKPIAWKVLDGLIGLGMLVIAWSLLS